MTIIFYTNAILGRASDLIKRGWTQGKMARDAHGNVTTSVSPNAARFCLVGAVRRAAFDVTGVDVATVDDGSGWFDEPEHRRVAAQRLPRRNGARHPCRVGKLQRAAAACADRNRVE